VTGVWRTWRLGGGVLLLGLLLWRFGTGPFADAWQVTTWRSVTAALLLTALATLANAWRWRVVSEALGVSLSPVESVTAYYRSQVLTTVLPGGVLGDPHRGTRHGRNLGDLGAGLRATMWDRVAGQLVQTGLVVVALGLLATPLRRYAPVVLTAVVLLVVGVWWLGRRQGGLAFLGHDLRRLLRPGVSGRLALASCLSTTAYVATFAVAVHAVGVEVGPTLALPLALLVLLGSAVPLNVAGWGPREGVTAAVFAGAGLASADGLTVSIAFGVLSAVATVPGALVLVADVVVRRRPDGPPARVLEGAHHA
jgi:uncharacterized membrane protein YbhN (UPF0104 family)